MSTAQLPGILQTVAPVLDHYGYAAVAGFLLLENFGVPLPGETILIAASVYAGAGKLNILVLTITAIVACIIGDNIGFAIGHFGGEKFVLKYGRYVFLSEKKLLSAQNFFNRYGGPVVLVARFIAGLRQLNGIVAGTAEMKWRTFLLFNTLGATLWVITWASFGFLAGSHIGAVYERLRHYEAYAFAGLAVLITIYIVRKVILRKKGDA